MELWFILALVSSVFAGLHIFVQKIGSARGYNSSLLNSYSAALSAVIGFTIAGIFEDFSDFSFLMLAIAFVSGLVYILGTNLRMDALKYIDATIFLPLHKFVSPLAALVLGIVFFNEVMNATEWWGIILGISVPLLLISSSEKGRQKNMSKGLLLMVVSAILAALVAAINKEGTNIFSSVLLFAAIANALGALAGVVLYRFRKRDLNNQIKETHFADPKLLLLSLVSGLAQSIGFFVFILAFKFNGPLAIVYTIHSLYIIIPIALSVIFYKEHWNMRKVVAIVLSIGALILLK